MEKYLFRKFIEELHVIDMILLKSHVYVVSTSSDINDRFGFIIIIIVLDVPDPRYPLKSLKK